MVSAEYGGKAVSQQFLQKTWQDLTRATGRKGIAVSYVYVWSMQPNSRLAEMSSELDLRSKH